MEFKKNLSDFVLSGAIYHWVKDKRWEVVMKSVVLSVMVLFVAASFAESNEVGRATNTPPTSFVKVFEKPPQVITNIATLGGKGYTNAIIITVEPDGLTLKLKSGIRKIYFTELSEDVQKEFGYDTEKAKKYQEDCAKARADSSRWRAEQAEAKRLEQEKYEKEQEEAAKWKKKKEDDARAHAETKLYEANLAARRAADQQKIREGIRKDIAEHRKTKSNASSSETRKDAQFYIDKLNRSL